MLIYGLKYGVPRLGLPCVRNAAKDDAAIQLMTLFVPSFRWLKANKRPKEPIITSGLT